MYTSANEYGFWLILVLNTFPPSVVVDEVCVSFGAPPGMNTFVTTAPDGRISPSSESSATLYTTQFVALILRAVTLMSRHPFASTLSHVTREATVWVSVPSLMSQASATEPPSSATPATSPPITRLSGILRYSRSASASSESAIASTLFVWYSLSWP